MSKSVGVGLIAAERKRQVGEEGWTATHDNAHDHGELSQAAAIYASQFVDSGTAWPWDQEWYKAAPKYRTWVEYRDAMLDPVNRVERIRELAKAGALVAAEIDRLERLG